MQNRYRCRSGAVRIVVIGEGKPSSIPNEEPPMKYLMLIAGDEAAWEAQTDAERTASYARVVAWWRAQADAGRIVGGHELQPSSTATTVRLDRDGRATVVDGPFVEAKEMLGGYAVLDVPDLDAAIALASSWPEPDTLEVRPIVTDG
jgi:hypothetical protein